MSIGAVKTSPHSKKENQNFDLTSQVPWLYKLALKSQRKNKHMTTSLVMQTCILDMINQIPGDPQIAIRQSFKD